MSDFRTITGQSWADALPKARKRRKGQGKRIAEAVKLTTAKNRRIWQSLICRRKNNEQTTKKNR